MHTMRQKYRQCPDTRPLHRLNGDGASLQSRIRRAGNVYPLHAGKY